MVDATEFGNALKELGYNFFSGVPCSFMKDFINFTINDGSFIMAANEGDGVAICAGAHLGGKKTVFLCQNSGLTNTVSPLTSLNYTFKIPTLGLVSLRGEEGINDEPQHELMGKITCDLLDLMKIKWAYLSPNTKDWQKQLIEANECINKGESFFFVVRKGTFSTMGLNAKPIPKIENKEFISQSKTPDTMLREDILKSVIKLKDEKTVFLATTGYTGRELYTINDMENNLYMVGSMGCISSLGLGLALSRPDLKVVVFDGDGSLLMRMGALSTVATYNPKNLIHILIDNNAHDSTGTQQTTSHNTDFIKLATSNNYSRSVFVHSIEELENEYSKWSLSQQLTFIELKSKPGKMDNLGRPAIKPFEVKSRLMNFIGATNEQN